MTTAVAIDDAFPAARRSSAGHRWKIILFGFLAVVVGAGSLWTLITLTFSYSDGDRVGYVQKFSHRGWLCRTWKASWR